MITKQTKQTIHSMNKFNVGAIIQVQEILNAHLQSGPKSSFRASRIKYIQKLLEDCKSGKEIIIKK